MTNKVKVPVLDALQLATWLSTNNNDLKDYIDNISLNIPGGGTGDVLTKNSPTSGDYSWLPPAGGGMATIAADIEYTVGGPGADYTTLGHFLAFIKDRYIAPGVIVTVTLMDDTTETLPVIWSHGQSSQIYLRASASNVTRTITATVPVRCPLPGSEISPSSPVSKNTTGFFLPYGNTLSLQASSSGTGASSISFATAFAANEGSNATFCGTIQRVAERQGVGTPPIMYLCVGSTGANQNADGFVFRGASLLSRSQLGDVTDIRVATLSGAPNRNQIVNSLIDFRFERSGVPGSPAIKTTKTWWYAFSSQVVLGNVDLGDCNLDIRSSNSTLTMSTRAYTESSSNRSITLIEGNHTLRFSSGFNCTYTSITSGVRVLYAQDATISINYGSGSYSIISSGGTDQYLKAFRNCFVQVSFAVGSSVSFTGVSGTRHIVWYSAANTSLRVGGDDAAIPFNRTNISKTNLSANLNGNNFGTYRGY